MSKRTTEIDCLERLQSFLGSLEDILVFLIEEKIINMDAAREIKLSSNIPKAICGLLVKLQDDSKLQLLEYDWQILPVERIRLTIVTDRVTKEFTHNY